MTRILQNIIRSLGITRSKVIKALVVVSIAIIILTIVIVAGRVPRKPAGEVRPLDTIHYTKEIADTVGTTASNKIQVYFENNTDSIANSYLDSLYNSIQ